VSRSHTPTHSTHCAHTHTQPPHTHALTHALTHNTQQPHTCTAPTHSHTALTVPTHSHTTLTLPTHSHTTIIVQYPHTHTHAQYSQHPHTHTQHSQYPHTQTPLCSAMNCEESPKARLEAQSQAITIEYNICVTSYLFFFLQRHVQAPPNTMGIDHFCKARKYV